MADINEKTRIPLFATLTALATIVPGIFWLASVDSKANATEGHVGAVEEKMHRMEDLYENRQIRFLEMLTEIRDRTIRIEERIKDK